jgi:predicted peroxiredoxin
MSKNPNRLKCPKCGEIAGVIIKERHLYKQFGWKASDPPLPAKADRSVGQDVGLFAAIKAVFTLTKWAWGKIFRPRYFLCLECRHWEVIKESIQN